MKTQTCPKRGNLNSPFFAYFVDKGCRTQAQYDTVKKLHAKYPSAWWLGDPFAPIGSVRFKCAFVHAFYDEKGRYTWVQIDPKGRIVDFDRDEETGAADEAKAVIEKYGAFRG